MSRLHEMGAMFLMGADVHKIADPAAREVVLNRVLDTVEQFMRLADAREKKRRDAEHVAEQKAAAAVRKAMEADPTTGPNNPHASQPE